MRRTFLPFAQPDLDGSEIARVVEVLRGGWLTTGPRTREFETRFAEFVGSEHAVAVNSCTAAMQLALESVGVGPGTEVITSPYTFAATAAVIQHLGGTPVFADVLPDTLTIDPVEVEAALSARTRAIVPVHLAGHPAEMEPLLSLATDHGLAVWKTPAHAFPRSIGIVGRVLFGSAETGGAGAEGGLLQLLLHQDNHHRRGRHDLYRRRRAGRPLSTDVIARNVPQRLDPLYAARFLVLRSRGRGIQVQYDRCGGGHGFGATR